MHSGYLFIQNSNFQVNCFEAFEQSIYTAQNDQIIWDFHYRVCFPLAVMNSLPFGFLGGQCIYLGAF